MKMTDDACRLLIAWLSIPSNKDYWEGRTDITDPKEKLTLSSLDCFLDYKVRYWAGELNQKEIDIWEKVGGWSWGPQNKFESWEQFGFK
jgi:hypothetical protein